MSPEEVRVGVKVMVRKRHRIEERRGMVGTVVGRYGGEGYVAVDVRLADGRYRLFWPEDLEEVSELSLPQPSPGWRSLLGGSSAQ